MTDQPQRRAFDLSNADLRRELKADRRTERLLWARAAVGLLVVAAIIILRVVVFP